MSEQNGRYGRNDKNGRDGRGGRDRRRTARDRLAVERERHKAREKRRRSLITGAAVIGVLGLAAVAGVLAANADGGKSDSEGPVVAPRGATGKDQLAIPLGKDTAKSTLTIWEDFRCPACRQFETAFRPTIRDLTGKGQLKVEYHLVTLIDHNLGGSGSLHAGNAAACAQQAGAFPRYHDVLFANQPEETKDHYADNATLIRLAGEVPGLVTPAFRTCVEDGTHNSWVAKSNQAFQDKKFPGTPAVFLNGTNVYADNQPPFTPSRLKSTVERAADG